MVVRFPRALLLSCVSATYAAESHTSWTYEIKRTETCSSHPGCEQVSSQEDCGTAGTAVGYPPLQPPLGTGSAWVNPEGPQGCFFDGRAAALLQWNAGPSPNVSCVGSGTGWHSTGCICRCPKSTAAPSLSHPTASPTAVGSSVSPSLGPDYQFVKSETCSFHGCRDVSGADDCKSAADVTVGGTYEGSYTSVVEADVPWEARGCYFVPGLVVLNIPLWFNKDENARAHCDAVYRWCICDCSPTAPTLSPTTAPPPRTTDSPTSTTAAPTSPFTAPTPPEESPVEDFDSTSPPTKAPSVSPSSTPSKPPSQSPSVPTGPSMATNNTIMLPCQSNPHTPRCPGACCTERRPGKWICKECPNRNDTRGRFCSDWSSSRENRSVSSPAWWSPINSWLNVITDERKGGLDGMCTEYFNNVCPSNLHTPGCKEYFNAVCPHSPHTRGCEWACCRGNFCRLCPYGHTRERFCEAWQNSSANTNVSAPAAWWNPINVWLGKLTDSRKDRLNDLCKEALNGTGREQLEITVLAGGDSDNITAVVRARAHDDDDEAPKSGDMSGLMVGSVVTAVILAVASALILAVVVCGGRKQPQDQRSAEAEMTELPVAEPTLPGSGSDEKGTTLPV